MTRPGPTIPPGRAPGLLVAVTADVFGEILTEDILDLEGVEEIATRHGTATGQGIVSAVYIYDGDSGVCVSTLRVDG